MKFAVELEIIVSIKLLLW